VTVLETPRLILRHYSLDDADALAEALCDQDNMRHFPYTFDRVRVIAWIEKSQSRYALDGVGKWAMVLKSDGSFAGDCGLVRQEVDGVTELEVGYVLPRRTQGQGLATEAARACMDYAFTRLKKDRVISLIRPENLPSRRVAERNGMTIEKETEWSGLPHLVYVARRPASAGPALSE
jgi:ribosomal-protein-alanine N-acetyltransferase